MPINFPVVKTTQNVCQKAIVQEYPVLNVEYYPNHFLLLSQHLSGEWANKPKLGVVVVPESDQSELVN